jgi:uncharacterized RDD family membrane protein YckC
MSDIQVQLPGGGKPYGGFWRRVVAAIIDTILLMIPIWIVASFAGISFGTLFGMDAEQMMENPDAFYARMSQTFMLMGTASAVIYLVYKAGFEGSGMQATPGKMVMGLRVTDRDGEPLSAGAAALRSWPWWAPSAFMALDGLLGTVGIMSNGIGIAALISYIVVAFTGRKQGVHDMMAGALVVKRGAQFEPAAVSA